MIKNLAIDRFISLDKTIPVVDVRTPAEFAQGHLVGAYNIALFSNEERVKVGTTYKQQGREPAILLGFDLTGSKWSGFIKQALEIAPGKKIALHCWRGGMRSGAMAWALNLYGFEVYLLEGGYKKYRRWVLDQFEQKYNLLVLGGMTGSGKTLILHQLKNLGEQIIDLEDLAQHQGSSYGSMQRMIQPSQEQFENELAAQLYQANKDKPIWIEDESITIGKRSIPNGLWRQMREANLLNIRIPAAQRIEFLVQEYGRLDKDFLVGCTQRIWKRLGPEQTKNAISAINEGRMADFISLVLVYYDKTYRAGLSKRPAESTYELDCQDTDASKNASPILEFSCKMAGVLPHIHSHDLRRN
ncbi:MAG: mnmH [Mucilaginibacter sp.]|nr:mnmH [Mucilaginibacter sp.]